MQNQIHIHEFHPELLRSGKPLASLAHADWVNIVDPSASFKSCNGDVSQDFPKWVNQTLVMKRVISQRLCDGQNCLSTV